MKDCLSGFLTEKKIFLHSILCFIPVHLTCTIRHLSVEVTATSKQIALKNKCKTQNAFLLLHASQTLYFCLFILLEQPTWPLIYFNVFSTTLVVLYIAMYWLACSLD